jgi:hypothetical protein
MAKLTVAIQRFIVTRLACHDTHSQVAVAVKEEFQVDVTRQQVYHYDPEREDAIKKWKSLFDAERVKFNALPSPGSQKSVRIRRLTRMAERAEANRNYKLAASLYEQIAKEEGGYYENPRAKPIAPQSEEDLITRMKGALAEMDERTVGPPAPSSPPPLTLERSA